MSKYMIGPCNNLTELRQKCNEIENYKIVKSMVNHKYYIYDAEYPTSGSFEEVILTKHNQRLRFDIDADNITWDEIQEPNSQDIAFIKSLITCSKFDPPIKIYKLLADIMYTIVDYMQYALLITDIDYVNDFALYSNNYVGDNYKCPADNEKHSFHIIVHRAYVNNSYTGSKIGNNIYYKLPQYAQQYYDRNVYKNGQQCLRLPGCHKPYKKLIKKQISKNGGYVYASGTEIKGMKKITLRSEENKNDIVRENQVLNEEVEKVAKHIEKWSNGDFKFRSYNDDLGIWNFYRMHPSFCDGCQRVHDSDNTLYGFVKNEYGDAHIYVSCIRKPKNVKLIGKFKSGKKLISKQELKKESNLDKKIESCIKDNQLNIMNEFKETLKCSKIKQLYHSSNLKPFNGDDWSTLLVRAPMKMGKTKELMKLIAEQPADDVIVIISFRQTFSEEMKRKFPDFELYNECTSRELTSNRIIVQVESLARLRAGIDIDLLILDESESIINQTGSKLANDSNRVYQLFIAHMKYAKRVIAMDAFLTDRTYKIVSACRPTDGIKFHYNKFKNAQDDKYYLMSSLNTLIFTLMDALEDGNCVFVANSLEVARMVHHFIVSEGILKDEECMIYSSETNPSVKREHFSDVNKYWANYKLIIYTPTATAGISFERKHFDRVFAYFTNESCTVETCLQMLGRVRNCSTHEYYIGFSNIPYNNLYKNEADVIKHIQRVSYGFLNADENALYSDGDIDRHGKYIPRDTPKNKIVMWNLIDKNKSKSMFIERFVMYVTSIGAQCELITEETYCKETAKDADDLKKMKSKVSCSKTVSKEKKADTIAEAKEITDEEYDVIDMKVKISSPDIHQDEWDAYNKKYLRKLYRFNGKMLTDFVITYSRGAIISKYFNWKRLLFDGVSVPNILKFIMQDKQINYEHSDETPRVSSDKLIIVLKILAILRITYLPKSEYKHIDKSMIKELSKFIEDNFVHICNSCSIGLPKQKKIDALTIADKVLKAMLGCKLNMLDDNIIYYDVPDLFNLGSNDNELIPHVEYNELFTE